MNMFCLVLPKKGSRMTNLTVTQWVSGFCRTIREEQNETMRSYMLDYIISLMDDANDFSWGAAKASHTVLLCRMEQGEIQDFSQTEKIDKSQKGQCPETYANRIRKTSGCREKK